MKMQIFNPTVDYFPLSKQNPSFKGENNLGSLHERGIRGEGEWQPYGKENEEKKMSRWRRNEHEEGKQAEYLLKESKRREEEVEEVEKKGGGGMTTVIRTRSDFSNLGKIEEEKEGDLVIWK